MAGGRRDDGTTGGQWDSRATGGQQDGGMTGGWRNDGRQQAVDDSTPTMLGAILGTRGHERERERERMVLLAKCIRRCIREQEGSGEKASIYMILGPILALRATPPTTPLSTPITVSIY